MSRNEVARIGLALGAAATLVAGCAQDEDANAADVAFAQEMIPHHAQALDMARLTEYRTANPEVLELAGQIEAAQDPEIETMSGWLEEWGEQVPDPSATDHSEMDHDGTGMMTAEQMGELAVATDAAFDRLFLELMIEHHEGAIAMSEAQLADGVNEEVNELAREIIEAQQAEIDYMRALLGEGSR